MRNACRPAAIGRPASSSARRFAIAALAAACLAGSSQARGETPAPAQRTAGSVSVAFVSRSAPGLDVELAPARPTLETTPGDVSRMFFFVTNHSRRELTVRFSYDVQPAGDAAFFSELQSQCTTDRVLGPGETDIVFQDFFLDKAILQAKSAGRNKLTVSYLVAPADASTAGR